MAATKLFTLDGREIGSFSDIEDLKWYAGALVSQPSEMVDIDDRYDEAGDCIEFVRVEGLGIVGTLDRPVPQGWKAISHG